MIIAVNIRTRIMVDIYCVAITTILQKGFWKEFVKRPISISDEILFYAVGIIAIDFTSCTNKDNYGLFSQTQENTKCTK